MILEAEIHVVLLYISASLIRKSSNNWIEENPDFVCFFPTFWVQPTQLVFPGKLLPVPALLFDLAIGLG